MSINLYGKYIKERENSEIHIHDNGFVTYKKIDDETYYLVDCFVEKEFRRTGLATQLGEEVCAIVKARGAKRVIGSISTDANGVTESLKAILAAGYKFASLQGTMLYFTKDL